MLITISVQGFGRVYFCGKMVGNKAAIGVRLAMPMLEDVKQGLYINTPQYSVPASLSFQAVTHGLLLALQAGVRVVRIASPDLIMAGQVHPSSNFCSKLAEYTQRPCPPASIHIGTTLHDPVVYTYARPRFYMTWTQGCWRADCWAQPSACARTHTDLPGDETPSGAL